MKIRLYLELYRSPMKKQYFLFLCTFLGFISNAQISDAAYVKKNYTKIEVEIPMRDGKTLFTQIYSPKDTSISYPILMQRTCYSVRPYGKSEFRKMLGPSSYLMREQFIFVYQDVRGRYMSEGTFDNMRPNIPGNNHRKEVDESSDTFDSIEWLLENVKNNNGKVGQWGISYPGFYTAAAIPDAHPALLASSPQAPIGDFYFDDFKHNGATVQAYLKAYPVFGVQKKEKVASPWYWHQFIPDNPEDGYTWNLKLGALKNANKYYKENFFFQQVLNHPNYDEFWKRRGLIQHLNETNHQILTVGGLFDAEDLYGPFNIYKAIEKHDRNDRNRIIMGPWSHGDWSRERGEQYVNDIYFGDSISTWYQLNIEKEFFTSILKENRKPNLPQAIIFDTGNKKWQKFNEWPSKNQIKTTLNFEKRRKLVVNGKKNKKQYTYISNPQNPVPYRSVKEGLVFTPRNFMTDDQRHAAKRKDVLTFKTKKLKEDITLSGEIMANLEVIISETDADFVVKIIDEFPKKHQQGGKKKIKNLGGYQMLVRSEVFRGRYRNGFNSPKAFKANTAEKLSFQLQDILHTFKKGHRIIVQIHSTWFPYIDINPQTFVKNISYADPADYRKAKIKLLGSSEIILNQLKN